MKRAKEKAVRGKEKVIQAKERDTIKIPGKARNPSATEAQGNVATEKTAAGASSAGKLATIKENARSAARKQWD